MRSFLTAITLFALAQAASLSSHQSASVAVPLSESEIDLSQVSQDSYRLSQVSQKIKFGHGLSQVSAPESFRMLPRPEVR